MSGVVANTENQKETPSPSTTSSSFNRNNRKNSSNNKEHYRNQGHKYSSRRYRERGNNGNGQSSNVFMNSSNQTQYSSSYKGRFGKSKNVSDNEVKREVQTFVKEVMVDKKQVQEDKDITNEINHKQTIQQKQQFRFNGNENQVRFGGTRSKFTFDTISSSSSDSTEEYEKENEQEKEHDKSNIIDTIKQHSESTKKEFKNDVNVDTESESHALYDKWTLYAHLPHDTDWSVDSYKPICEFATMEECIGLVESLPDVVIKNCMLFLMRGKIRPVWEDPGNRDGGCFSYKINNKQIVNIWKNVCFSTVGETLTENPDYIKHINGITVSPKRSFCILKIWMSDFKYQDATNFIQFNCFVHSNAIYKKHEPEH